ncbi:MAG: 7,8-dihydroneopterin aldolase/epimerase/oxygenase [Frankiaceae bacterium]|nr:7,8-dihydroneopterin aldolase/epimerase/oxygenase [Frankiaceae bacterium]
MSDRIELHGLRIHGRHGVLPEERRDGQLFGVDVSLEVDTRAAAASDDLADTVDYSALAHKLADVVAGEPVALLETLAQRLADVCLDEARVLAVDVAVHKPNAPVGLPFDDVIVRVRRVRT